jgi:Glycosyl hydrolases family 18
MKKVLVLFFALVLLCSTSFAQRKYVGWSMGYLPGYANFSVSKINWKCYTIITWFANSLSSSGTVSGMSASQAQALTTACHQNNTKAVICFGGAGAGGMFTSATGSGVVATSIANMVSYMQTNKFDGIDIDWEDGINQTQYAALVQGLSTALAKISPKPLLTIATADYFSQNTAPLAAYADQLNIMSYYDGATSIPSEVGAFTSKGVPKGKLGIGYGYDTDNEVDGPNEAGNGANGNPNDINAKCDSTANHGYGGLMVWEIDRAPAICDSVTASWVNKNATSTIPSNQPVAHLSHRAVFAIVNNAATGVEEIRYSVPSAEAVSFELFNMNGVKVQSLAAAMCEPGIRYTIAIGKKDAGIFVAQGTYVAKMATPTGTEAGTVVVK